MRVSRGCTLLVVFVSLFSGTCESGRSTRPILPPGTNTASNGLVFTLEGGTAIPMGGTHAVCCSTWEPGRIDREALKIFYYDTTKRSSYWKMFLIPSQILEDSVLTLPTPAPGDGPVAIAATDVATGDQASSERAGSSGTVTLRSFSCGPPTEVDATVDAVLGSTSPGGRPIRVKGRFTATVYTNPISCSFSF